MEKALSLTSERDILERKNKNLETRLKHLADLLLDDLPSEDRPQSGAKVDALLSDRIEELKRKAEHMEKLYDDTHKENDELLTEIVKLEHDHRNQTRAFEEKREEMRLLDDDHDRLLHALIKGGKVRSDLRQENDDLRAQNASLEGRTAKLSGQLKSMEAEHRELQAMMDELCFQTIQGKPPTEKANACLTKEDNSLGEDDNLKKQTDALRTDNETVDEPLRDPDNKVDAIASKCLQPGQEDEELSMGGRGVEIEAENAESEMQEDWQKVGVGYSRR